MTSKSEEITIDLNRCMGHARCHSLAPAVYDLDDDGKSIVIANPVPAELATMPRKAHRRAPNTRSPFATTIDSASPADQNRLTTSKARPTMTTTLIGLRHQSDKLKLDELVTNSYRFIKSTTGARPCSPAATSEAWSSCPTTSRQAEKEVAPGDASLSRLQPPRTITYHPHPFARLERIQR